MAAKFVIDLILSSMRRAIAHFDTAMFCAHVMLRNFAPLKPSETQTAALLRDLQDNVSAGLGLGQGQGVSLCVRRGRASDGSGSCGLCA